VFHCSLYGLSAVEIHWSKRSFFTLARRLHKGLWLLVSCQASILTWGHHTSTILPCSHWHWALVGSGSKVNQWYCIWWFPVRAWLTRYTSRRPSQLNVLLLSLITKVSHFGHESLCLTSVPTFIVEHVTQWRAGDVYAKRFVLSGYPLHWSAHQSMNKVEPT